MTQRGRHRAPGRHAKPKDPQRRIQASLIVLGVFAAVVFAKAQTVPSSVAAEADTSNYVNAQALSDSAAADTVMRQGAVQTGTKLVTHRVKFSVIVRHDKSLPKGRKVVRRSGSAGKAVVVYQVRSVNGVEVSRSQVRRSIVVEPTTKVVAVGVAEPTPTVAVSPGSAQAFAQSYIADKYSWGNDQFGCLVQLWGRESHWNVHAHNSGSGAHGIPQAMPGSKMASAGPDWYNNAETQIKWGANYISGRYGNPCSALGHSNSTGWY
jgi:resuscitation-promoting factor RpfB